MHHVSQLSIVHIVQKYVTSNEFKKDFLNPWAREKMTKILKLVHRSQDLVTEDLSQEGDLLGNI